MRWNSWRNRFASTLVALMVISSSPVGAFAHPLGAADRSITLARELGGDQAIAALGADLPEVARRHRTSATELKRAFRTDKSLRVNSRGKLLYREAALGADAALNAADTTPWDQATGYPLEETFRLHSKPDAKRVIYLDFDGHILQGTAWNAGSVPGTLACPSWDLDGDPSVFDATERAKIQQIWQRVSEDYAPFDVDVTTEAPDESRLSRTSSADDTYGMRVLVSPISPYFGNYGGVAYVDAFDSIGDLYRAALVFPENLAHKERSVAEAVSHEVGHTFGLLHDGTTAGVSYYRGSGTGVTGWAPIMGTSYYQNMTQWSRGEYALANNQQDDIAVIAAGGAPVRPDDHPNACGVPIAESNSSGFSARGIIADSQDVDVVPFRAGAGPVHLQVTPAAVGANLDARIEIRDSAGTLIGSADPPDAIGATVDLTVSQGVYYAVVSGAGYGEPATGGYSNYGSVGAWSLTGLVADPGVNLQPSVAISASATSGVAPARFRLDASSAFDPEGGTLSWHWDLGNGTFADGAVVEPQYDSPGTYMASVTVTDQNGLSDSASVLLNVTAPNLPPVAAFRATGSGASAPALGNFDGSLSSDADGVITKYSWDFGDGTVGSGATVSHVYPTAGRYTVTLRVEDEQGASSSMAYEFVAMSSSQVLHIDGLSIAVTTAKSGKVARATVRVADGAGAPVSGVTVTGSWSGAVSGSATGITNSEGDVILSSKTYRKSGPVTFVVTGLRKSGWNYDPSQNVLGRVTGG